MGGSHLISFLFFLLSSFSLLLPAGPAAAAQEQQVSVFPLFTSCPARRLDSSRLSFRETSSKAAREPGVSV